MSRPVPTLPAQFAKLAALYRSSTFEGERETARRKAEALLAPEVGGFDRALRIQAYHDARAAAPNNLFAGFDEMQEIDEPGHMARQAAQRADKRAAWLQRRAALVERYGSLEAVLEPCAREMALRKALKPWRVPAARPHHRWTRELKGWESLTLASKMSPDLRAAVERAIPMPTTYAEARAEFAFWQDRDDELQDALSTSEQLLGDYGLDRVCVARMEIIRDVVEHEMRLETLPEILERFRIYHARDNLDEADMEAAILRDLEALAAREAAT